MTTDYDPIAEQYKLSKQQPWRTYIECCTLMKLIGDPQEMAVLDVACGEGFYRQMIRELPKQKEGGSAASHSGNK